MFTYNRRHTEALEKSARALKRLANAEETIVRNLDAFLRDEDEATETPPPFPAKNAPPPKVQPSKK